MHGERVRLEVEQSGEDYEFLREAGGVRTWVMGGKEVRFLRLGELFRVSVDAREYRGEQKR